MQPRLVAQKIYLGGRGVGWRQRGRRSLSESPACASKGLEVETAMVRAPVPIARFCSNLAAISQPVLTSAVQPGGNPGKSFVPWVHLGRKMIDFRTCIPGLGARSTPIWILQLCKTLVQQRYMATCLVRYGQRTATRRPPSSTLWQNTLTQSMLAHAGTTPAPTHCVSCTNIVTAFTSHTVELLVTVAIGHNYGMFEF